MSKQRTLILAALGALVPFLWLTAHFWWTCDDALISFRYSKHLAEGTGLIFNPGEAPPVEGFSNLLWILVLTPLRWLGVNVPLAANLISSACGAWLIMLVLRYCIVRLQLRPWLVLAVGLFLVSLPSFTIWSTSGLESMPFALAVFGLYAALCQDPDHPQLIRASVFACAAALLRADGALWCSFAFLAALCTWFENRQSALLRVIFLSGMTLSLMVALHFLWRHSYFGEWLPNTAKIKVGFSALRGERGLKYLASLILAVPSIGLLLVLAPLSIRRGQMVLPSALVFVLLNCLYAIYVGGDFMTMGRFVVPSLPFLALVFALTCDRIARPLPIAAFSITLICVGLLACFDKLPVASELRQKVHFRWNGPEARSEIEQWKFMDRQALNWSNLGRALALHTQPGESLIRGNIGGTGYYSELVLFDQNGLVIPEVAERSQPLERASPGHDRRVDESFFFDRQPTYFAAMLVPQAAALQRGVPPDAIPLLRAGRLVQERYPLSTQDGFSPASELRLLRFRP